MASGVVYAQSSVTLYGIIDEGVNYNSNANGNRLYNLSSGVFQGSRWGLRGKEDLGGGLGAIFVLENGFDVNTGRLGQGGLLFGRQAYVGISSPYGTVTFGRQYDSVVTTLDLSRSALNGAVTLVLIRRTQITSITPTEQTMRSSTRVRILRDSPSAASMR